MQRLVLDSQAYGIQVVAALTFTDFDPTGGTALLKLIHLPERAMALVGAVATYTTTPQEFTPGKYDAVVLVTKGSVRVSSERFLVEVL